MRSAPALCSMMAVVSMYVVACSSGGSPAGGGGSTVATNQGGNSTASGGTASAGTSSQAGSKASGGASSSGTAGQGGSSASGGKSEVGGTGAGGTSRTGGTSASSATTHPGTGGTGASGGRASSGTPGATGGQSGTAGGGGTAAGTGGTGPASTAKGGNTGATGGTSAGGTGGSPSSGTPGTDAVKSDGCGKTSTLVSKQSGAITIQSTRKYYLRVPSDYDNSHPYRLVFTFAESGSSAKSVVDRSYFRFAGFDSKSTIFVAPDAANSAGSWSKTDVDLTDAILAEVSGDLCIDKSRIFASGFSFGGGMAIAIACTRADVFRGVAFWSGADLTNSCPATLTKPIAYWASQASGDSSGTPMPTSGKVKQAAFAAVNGCTAEPSALTFPAVGQPHTCTVYKNCSAGHPTVYCVFDGGHGWEPKDPGQSTSWAPAEAWKFITQF